MASCSRGDSGDHISSACSIAEDAKTSACSAIPAAKPAAPARCGKCVVSPSQPAPKEASVGDGKKRFAECALIEIIHLHDCLRGALQQMHEEVKTLKQMLAKSNSDCVDLNTAKNLEKSIASRFHLIWSVFQAHSGAEDEFIWPALELKLKREDNNNNKSSADGNMCCFGAEEYEEDHQEEEKLFKDVNTTLGRLKGSFRFYEAHKIAKRSQALFIMKKASAMLDDQIDGLVRHLTQHLEKEETQCLPKIQSLLTKEEISSLVGNIMGKRSAELMGKILELAVKQLPMDERDDMVRHMKDAMAGTFFAKWLDVCFKDKVASLPNDCNSKKRKHPEVDNNESESLEKPTRKISFCSTSDIPETSQRHPPAKYYKAQKSGKIICLYDSENSSNKTLNSAIPLLTKEELRPTYHCNKEGETKLGCKHYARACKIRHPLTGQIFNCRLCCEEVREANGYRDLPVLDRNEVTEVLCMRCNTLQPAGPACISDKCRAKPRFAKYSCKICNLYDDSNKDIYHCPYCNVCRKGKGLGIDFRHCMRCNACISLKEYNDHVCIPQRLQGNCPICHEKLFESTAPLRGLPCGHVMHLSCFKLYVANSSRLGTISCPYCKREFQNINE